MNHVSKTLRPHSHYCRLTFLTTTKQGTNWQSRTALVIMPALFTFAFTSERMLDYKMQELANRNEHIRKSAAWANEKHAENVSATTNNNETFKGSSSDTGTGTTESQLLELYRQSVISSGVRIVPKLGPHHVIANFWQEHPFRMLAAAAVPAVGYIYYGRNDGLQLQMKVMHTRVMGQFTVLALLLSLMGFKEYMDKNGKFITEEDAERRVMEMAEVRQGLLRRLEMEKQHQAEIDAKRKQAHEEDIKTGHVHHRKIKAHNKTIQSQGEQVMKEIESV